MRENISMKSPNGRDDQVGNYRIPTHYAPAKARRARWGIGAASISGVAAVVALIILTGTGGATADVPMSLQVGAQAATTSTWPDHSTTTVRTTTAHRTVATTTTPTTPTTIVAPTTTAPTTMPSTTIAPTTTTTTPTQISIVVPKSKVSEGDSGKSDDSGRHDDSSAQGVDN